MERLVTAFTELSRSSFHVLFCQYPRNVTRYQLILRHHIRFQPDTHGVVGTHHIGITHTAYTLDFRNQVDTCVVFEELDVVFVFLIIDRENHQHRGLTLHGGHTDLRYFSRQQTLSLSHTVLHIDLRHIGVSSLIKIHCDTCRAIIGSGRLHVHHVFHTIDLVLQRRNHRVQYSLRIGTCIGRTNRNGRRRNVRILGNWQSSQTDKTQDYQQN